MAKRRVDIGWLRVFDAVARLGNLTRAADELGISQPAVSYQIRQLEAQVGVPLIRRLHRGTELSRAGDILQRAVRGSLDQIDAALQEIQVQAQSPTVRMFTDYGFATFWLMPRVSEFRRRNPGTEVHIIASQALEPDVSSVADTAVMFGKAEDFGGRGHLLMPERVVPVCSPGFLDQFGPIDNPTAIAGAQLLHLDSLSDPRWITWRDWFAAHGETPEPGRRDLGLNTYSLVIQAAIAGEGVALGWRGLVETQLESGALVPLGPELQRPEWGYWLVPDPSGNRVADQLNAWLLEN